MRYIKTLAAAAVVAALGTSVAAGGFSPVVEQPAPPPVVIVDEAQPRTPAWVPLLAIGALVALAVNIESNDDSEADPEF